MEEKIPRRQSKKDRLELILKRLEDYQEEGLTTEQALERLTLKQYDFLIDSNIDLEKLKLTKDQKDAVKKATRSPRPAGLKYDKTKCPESRKMLFNNLENTLMAQGAIITPRETPNYRDIDFTLDGVIYKIVLSKPRPIKN